MRYALDTARTFRSTGGNPASRIPPQKKLPPQRLGGPLSNEQKARLCILCREAWEQNGSKGALDDYRHLQVDRAVGKPGLTACTQDDYKPLVGHFLNLTGHPDRAMNAHLDHATEDVRVAQFKLHAALKKAGLPIAYAATICRRQYKCGIEAANTKQLWQLIYTINNRAASRRRN